MIDRRRRFLELAAFTARRDSLLKLRRIASGGESGMATLREVDR